ncbi:MAG: gliding motility-associated C-terminal domain-containing protein [Flavobacteriales bacterium]
MALPAIAQLSPIQARFEPGCDGTKAFFSTPLQGATYFWDFGDGATSTAREPVHTYPYGVKLYILLTVTDEFGATITTSTEFEERLEDDLTDLEFPNIFTPNSDGINDVFTPMTDRLLGPCAHLSVFNRYGERVFETLGNNIEWNGRSMDGELVVPGVYFYVFSVNGLEFTGNVSLHR